MKYKNENDIKKALGVESLENLSQEEIQRFSMMMPDMDRELAYKIVGQIPEFTSFALGTVNAMQKTAEAAYAHDREGQARVHDAWEQIREILSRELDKDELSWEQKQYYTDLVMETGRQQSATLGEGRQWSKDIYKLIPTFSYVALLATMVLIGGKLGMDQVTGGGGNS